MTEMRLYDIRVTVDRIEEKCDEGVDVGFVSSCSRGASGVGVARLGVLSLILSG